MKFRGEKFGSMKRLSHTLSRLFKTGLAAVLFLSLSLKAEAQGDDYNNHYKGLLGNRFDTLENWSCHFQFTTIEQGHPTFHALYSGQNSLQPASESHLSVTSTLFLGRRLWQGASIFLDAEIAGGEGMSYSLGLAGAANGETFRIGNPAPALYVARGYFEQNIALRSNLPTEHRSGEQNKIADNVPTSRITITVGKFSLADFFDDNAYSHDPRGEFMNWALMDNGAWDYPANTRGYTWGAVVELFEPGYEVRLSSVLVPKIANSEIYDLDIHKAHGETAEFVKKFNVLNYPGTIRILGFANFSRAPRYATAVQQMSEGDSALIKVIRGQLAGGQYGGVKYGWGLNVSQQLSTRLGLFSRVGWNDGQTATWAFTEIDRTASAGIRIRTDIEKRPDNNFGLAFIVNGISAAHRNYLNAGGYGFILGDGRLTHYGEEQIVEAFYKVKLIPAVWVTADYQFVVNPGYNRDRGPVQIFALRTHIEF